MKLTAAEKETVILFSEADETASVCTYDSRLKVKLVQLAAKFPDRIIKFCVNRDVMMKFTVPKSCIVVYPPHTDEWRAAARERAKITGFQPRMTDN